MTRLSIAWALWLILHAVPVGLGFPSLGTFGALASCAGIGLVLLGAPAGPALAFLVVVAGAAWLLLRLHLEEAPDEPPPDNARFAAAFFSWLLLGPAGIFALAVLYEPGVP